MATPASRSRTWVIVMSILLIVVIAFAIYLVVLAIQQTNHKKHSSSASSSDSNNCTPFVPRYIYVYNVGAQTGFTGTVSFDSQGQTSAGFTHSLGSAEITVNTGSEGVYQASFMVQPSTGATGVNQFGIAVDGSLVAGTTYGQTALPVPIIGQATLQLYGGSVVTIVNVDANVIGLAAQPNSSTNASLILKKLKR
jgi:hypothetical protein